MVQRARQLGLALKPRQDLSSAPGIPARFEAKATDAPSREDCGSQSRRLEAISRLGALRWPETGPPSGPDIPVVELLVYTSRRACLAVDI